MSKNQLHENQENYMINFLVEGLESKDTLEFVQVCLKD